MGPVLGVKGLVEGKGRAVVLGGDEDPGTRLVTVGDMVVVCGVVWQ